MCSFISDHRHGTLSHRFTRAHPSFAKAQLSLYPAEPRQESRTALGRGEPALAGSQAVPGVPQGGQLEQSCALSVTDPA